MSALDRKGVTAERLSLRSYTVHRVIASTQHRAGREELCEADGLLACEVHAPTSEIYEVSYTVHRVIASTQHRAGREELCEADGLLACEVHAPTSEIYEV
ncbi:hypothetical protein T265_09893 [Opisthorchis viverrini]|uniref:Uncharacterized protein n=1 Tax=Opisthorchis viverrini TaxID=6198 RepID=A0A074Z4A5_OPIVI|nr:hypothetical protein T265_09893 [Opisthorchis viverrini]KER21888.1 hypothetical protein T265_09893 [Opisthorchis viverrini]